MLSREKGWDKGATLHGKKSKGCNGQAKSKTRVALPDSPLHEVMLCEVPGRVTGWVVVFSS